jgi:CxxC-x17-CxxC domain-containing protein
MSDRTLICRDCDEVFTFTAGEQAFYAERGYSAPQRCPSCRAARKAHRAAAGYETGYPSGRAAGFRQMYPAVCSACGRDTEVPFPPRGDKPVYCRECFQERRPAAMRPHYGRY